MKRFFLVLFMVIGFILGRVEKIEALSVTPAEIEKITETATAAATVVPVRENITEPQSQVVKDRLQIALEGQNLGEGKPWLFMRRGIRLAVERGVSANTVVLLLVLPLVASLVAFLHYIMGITGYGIFTPAMMAVAFLAAGVPGGLALFATILVITTIAMIYLRKIRLHYWPRRALVLLAVCLGTGTVMVLSSWWGFLNLAGLSIFPVLILILVTEGFVRTQLAKSRREARRLAVGTLLLSLLGAAVMGWQRVQSLVLLYPETVILITITVNVLAGRYHGIRLSEIKRFKGGLR